MGKTEEEDHSLGLVTEDHSLGLVTVNTWWVGVLVMSTVLLRFFNSELWIWADNLHPGTTALVVSVLLQVIEAA